MNVIKGKLFLTTVQKDGELTVLGRNEAMRQLLDKFSPPQGTYDPELKNYYSPEAKATLSQIGRR